MASKAKPSAPAAKAETVTVTANTHLHVDGTTYKPGDTLELSATRAASLGDLVTPV